MKIKSFIIASLIIHLTAGLALYFYYNPIVLKPQPMKVKNQESKHKKKLTKTINPQKKKRNQIKKKRPSSLKKESLAKKPLKSEPLTSPEESLAKKPLKSEPLTSPEESLAEKPLKSEPLASPEESLAEKPLRSEPLASPEESLAEKPLKSEPLVSPEESLAEKPLKSEPLASPEESLAKKPLKSEPLASPEESLAEKPLRSEPLTNPEGVGEQEKGKQSAFFQDVERIVEEKVEKLALTQNEQDNLEIRDFFNLKQQPNNPKIFYPVFAREDKMQGTVSVLFFVDKKGLVDKIQLEKSSGHAELDNFVIRILARHQFLEKQEGWVRYRQTFILEGVEEKYLKLRSPEINESEN